MEISIGLLLTAFMIALALLLFYLFKEIRQQQQPQVRVRSRQFHPRTATPSAKTHMEKRLSCMLAGDRAAALRLVAIIRQRNPGKDEEWCWQKAIADLERDRR